MLFNFHNQIDYFVLFRKIIARFFAIKQEKKYYQMEKIINGQ